MAKPKILNSQWDHACVQKVYRKDIFGQEHLLEPGVNYFVLKLEDLGARTLFSCEGHPRDFYILMEADYQLALVIARCGFFNVAIAGSSFASLVFHKFPEHLDERNQKVLEALARADKNYWTVRLSDQSANTESKKRHCLRLAAAKWEEKIPTFLSMRSELEKAGEGARRIEGLLWREVLPRHDARSRLGGRGR
jgi:hypothetical protein